MPWRRFLAYDVAGAAYLPARYVGRYIEAGELRLVPDAPAFPFPIWAVWRNDLDPELARVAQEALGAVVAGADATRSRVLEQLRDLSEDHEISVMGSDRVLLDK